MICNKLFCFKLTCNDKGCILSVLFFAVFRSSDGVKIKRENSVDKFTAWIQDHLVLNNFNNDCSG